MSEMIKAYQSNKAAAAEYASPHQLICMLFDGAMERLARAIGHAERGEVAAKGECIGRVVMILDNLQASLDTAAGDGQIANNLSDLYDYMMRRLTEANLRSDPAIMSEVHELLRELAGAWRAVSPDVAGGAGAGSVGDVSRSSDSA